MNQGVIIGIVVCVVVMLIAIPLGLYYGGVFDKDCELTPPEKWGECIKGKQTGTQIVKQQSGGRGKACPTDLDITRDCSDCVLDPPTKWSDCKDGKQTGLQLIKKAAINGGKACPTDLNTTRNCTVEAAPAPIDCVVGAPVWSACIDGFQNGTQTITTPASNGGKACPTDLTLKRACEAVAATNVSVIPTTPTSTASPVNCQMAEPAVWSTCKFGTQTGVRTITVQPFGGGELCPTDLTTSRTCSNEVKITLKGRSGTEIYDVGINGTPVGSNLVAKTAGEVLTYSRPDGITRVTVVMKNDSSDRDIFVTDITVNSNSIKNFYRNRTDLDATRNEAAKNGNLLWGGTYIWDNPEKY